MQGFPGGKGLALIGQWGMGAELLSDLSALRLVLLLVTDNTPVA